MNLPQAGRLSALHLYAYRMSLQSQDSLQEIVLSFRDEMPGKIPG